MSITSRGHQGLITYESCTQNSAHSIFSLFACHLFPSACGHPGWCQAILYYIGFLGGGKSAGERTGTNSGQTNSRLENKHRIYSTEIHVTVEGIESSGSCSRLQERKREKFLRWIFRNEMSIKRFEFSMKRELHGLNEEKGKKSALSGCVSCTALEIQKRSLSKWSCVQIVLFFFFLRNNLIHRKIIPQHFIRLPQQLASTHLYSWVKRGTLVGKCCAQEHNTVNRPGLEPRPLDPESTASPSEIV